MMRLGLIGATLLLYLGTQCAVGMADTAGGSGSSAELARLNAEILRHPQDTALNLRYAALAEKIGKRRLALSAYERILIYDPQNAEALDGVYRIRKGLQPNTTQYSVGLGAIYESNPLYLPSGTIGKGEGQAFGTFNVMDERTVGDYRWRTIADVDGIAHGTDNVLDYARAGAMTGPVWELLPGIQVNPALGGGGAYFDDHLFYGEAAASTTFEAYPNGAYESVTLRAALRDYDTFFVPEHDGGYVEATGKFTVPLSIPNTAFSFSPWLRWAEIKGTIGTMAAFATMQPGDYTDVGGRINGYYSLYDWVVLGANFSASERYYRDEIATGSTAERRDTTLSPGASIIFPHLGQYQNALRFDYRYISNDSNDAGFTYVDHVVTVTATRKF